MLMFDQSNKSLAQAKIGGFHSVTEVIFSEVTLTRDPQDLTTLRRKVKKQRDLYIRNAWKDVLYCMLLSFEDNNWVPLPNCEISSVIPSTKCDGLNSKCHGLDFSRILFKHLTNTTFQSSRVFEFSRSDWRHKMSFPLIPGLMNTLRDFRGGRSGLHKWNTVVFGVDIKIMSCRVPSMTTCSKLVSTDFFPCRSVRFYSCVCKTEKSENVSSSPTYPVDPLVKGGPPIDTIKSGEKMAVRNHRWETIGPCLSVVNGQITGVYPS